MAPRFPRQASVLGRSDTFPMSAQCPLVLQLWNGPCCSGLAKLGRTCVARTSLLYLSPPRGGERERACVARTNFLYSPLAGGGSRPKGAGWGDAAKKTRRRSALHD